MPQRIHLVTSSDENYLTGVVALLASAALNLDKGCRLQAHVVTFGVAQDVPHKIRQALCPLAHTGMEVAFVTADHLALDKFPITRQELRPAIYARLFIPDLLPSLDRAIYADSDMIIHCDLAPLWRMITDEEVLLAVGEGRFGQVLPHCATWNVRPEAPYFNSGLLAMNLAAIRRRGDAARSIELARDTKFIFPQNDQDVLNIAYHDVVRMLPKRWNTTTVLSEDAVSLSPLHPCVIHTIWRYKPWMFQRERSHGVVKLFYDYLDQTDWLSFHSDMPRYRQRASSVSIALLRARQRIARMRGRSPAIDRDTGEGY